MLLVSRPKHVLMLAACTLVLLNVSQSGASFMAVKKVAPSQKTQAEVKDPTPLVVRVGAIYYDDDKTQYSTIEKILSAVAKRDSENDHTPGRRPLVFKLAVGTYDEVLDWYETDQIDLAIMNPGPMALLLHRYRDVLDEVFVGVRRRKPPKTSLAASTVGPASRAYYNSIMLLNPAAVRTEFPSKTPTDQELFELVKSKARDKKVHFFRSQAKSSDQMFDLLFPSDKAKASDKAKDWKADYEKVRDWIIDFNGKKPLMSSALTIDQIIRRINNYNLHHPKPARLAIVLSGGGAKCAYQLGAVEVIEDELEKARNADNNQKLDINLVVGTSGGAINALTVAARATRNDSDARDKLKKTWMNFGQSEILRPSNFVRRLIGATLGFLAAFSFVYICYLVRRRRLVDQPKAKEHMNGRPWFQRAGIILLVASLILFIAGRIQLDLASSRFLTPKMLLDYHVWIHFIEYGRQSLRWMAFAMAICGFLLCIAAFRRPRSFLSRNFEVIERRRGLLVVAVISIAFLLPLIAIYTALRLEESLFVADGIQQKMALEIPTLLNVKTPADYSLEALQDLSRRIAVGDSIKRDLVITGSMLPLASAVPSPSPQLEAAESKPRDESDLYFFYLSDRSAKLPNPVLKDSRFVDLRDRDNESILLDAVIGSGAIFPAFEPREIPALRRITDTAPIPKVSIIDGGFVHNSPIDAAVQLDATHIIVIEASPEDRPFQQRDFLTNTLSAFNYLFTQAQLLDARSRRQAEIFTLRPDRPAANETPYLCTLDFGAKFIERAMELGRADAQRKDSPAFKRQPRPAALD